MGYVFALIAVLCGATKGFCGKKISGYTSELKSAAFANFLRMTLCILIGFFFVLFDTSVGIGGLAASGQVVGISLISGISTSVFVISWLLAIRRGAFMMVDVFLTVGVVIPMILSNIFYGEPIGLNDGIGVALLLVAAAIMCSYSSGIKQKVRLGDILLMSLSGAANGFVSFSQKMFVNNGEGSSATVFNFYTYVFSAAVLLAFYLISTYTEKRAAVAAEGGKVPEKKGMPLSVLAYVTAMAICLFAHSFFNTLAAQQLSAAELYPLSQGLALTLASIMAAVFFGEKIKLRSVIGIAITFVGLLVINLL